MTDLHLSWEEAEMLISKFWMELLTVVNKYTLKNECSSKEAQFLTSKSRMLTIHTTFLHHLENLKTPPIDGPVVAGYDWIVTPASICGGHFLKEFYSKFDSILTDSLSFVKVCTLIFQWKSVLIWLKNW